jgi:cell wall-associated NlpC family hydrolase
VRSSGEPAVELPDPSWLPAVPEVPEVVTTTLRVVPGTTARMRADGRAAIPHDAPARVRAVIRAANAIVGRPYRWGGGHQHVVDSGYDCSGAVSYALIKSGQLRSPLVSGELARTYRPVVGQRTGFRKRHPVGL